MTCQGSLMNGQISSWHMKRGDKQTGRADKELGGREWGERAPMQLEGLQVTTLALGPFSVGAPC